MLAISQHYNIDVYGITAPLALIIQPRSAQ
jgi:hypothetical protein